MAASNSAAREAAEHELVITRVLKARRSVVFALWTEREHLMRWWGPQGFTVPACAIDFRPGGSYRFQMRAPDGTDHWLQGVFQEIVAPERIVCTFTWTDGAGQPTHPATLLTVTFAELGTQTTLTLRQSELPSAAAREEHREGWTSALESLAAYLATVPSDNPLKKGA